MLKKLKLLVISYISCWNRIFIILYRMDSGPNPWIQPIF